MSSRISPRSRRRTPRQQFGDRLADICDHVADEKMREQGHYGYYETHWLKTYDTILREFQPQLLECDGKPLR